MYKIRYYYSSLSKQFFLIFVIWALLVRLLLFFAGGFYKDAYVGATVAVYALALALCIFFFTGWKFFYYEFDQTSLTGFNLLTKKKTELDLVPVQRALFSKSGISLFYKGDQIPRYFIPFRRLGVISPVGVENFMNLMKNRGVHVEQQYQVLPGHGKGAAWIGRCYTLLAILVALSSVQSTFLVFLILAAPK